MSDKSSRRRDTSLGPAVERHASTWVLDLTDLPILHGLSVLSRALAEAAVSQAQADRIDIDVERTVKARENPELISHWGVRVVKLCAEHETLGRIAHHPDLFEDHLRAVFGSLQRQNYREALFPSESDPNSTALVFHLGFPADSSSSSAPASVVFRFVLEFIGSPSEEARGYLRVTIEDPRGRRLELDSIAHLELEDRTIASRTFISGATRIAQTWAEGIRRAAERRRRSLHEEKSAHNHLFKQLAKAGLEHVQKIELSWGESFVPYVLESEPTLLEHLLKKILLALEDSVVRDVLEESEALRIDVGDVSVYLESSQLARVLHVSLGQRRLRTDLNYFLDRMPALSRVVDRGSADLLEGISVFLVHHITADVLGLIAALRSLGCRDLVTLFVAYGAEAPGSYFSALLDLPSEEFTAAALTQVPQKDKIEGHYRLSAQYSASEGVEKIDAALCRDPARFYEAMQTTAKLLFVEQLERTRARGHRCLIIEDGGYLAPDLNQACLDGASVREFIAAEDPGCTDDRLLADVLSDTLMGSVEHTRNGYERLRDVEQTHGTLAFPAFSIAISRRKIDIEAREVAVSILNATENVLHAAGLILSRRRCVVIGSRGAIGSSLVDLMRHRLDRGTRQLAGVDTRAEDETDTGLGIHEALSFSQLPDDVRLACDLIIGVTGTSALRGEDVSEWIARGTAPRLILVSGSTKTEEFKHVSSWMEGLLATDADAVDGSQSGDADRAPGIEGRPFALESHELLDPITGRLFGHRHVFQLGASADGLDARRRELVFLANLTPINFMFYGVPTELIDEVLGDLLSCGMGLVRRAKKETLPASLQAVDYEITVEGKPLSE